MLRFISDASVPFSLPPYIACPWDVLVPSLIYLQNSAQCVSGHLHGEKNGQIAGTRLNIVQKDADGGDRLPNSPARVRSCFRSRSSYSLG